MTPELQEQREEFCEHCSEHHAGLWYRDMCFAHNKSPNRTFADGVPCRILTTGECPRPTAPRELTAIEREIVDVNRDSFDALRVLAAAGEAGTVLPETIRLATGSDWRRHQVMFRDAELRKANRPGGA